MASAATHRVVIVGAGFGGLFATRFLRHAPVEVTLVDRTNHHLFQPLLYQVATGILSAGEVAPPTRDVLKGDRNVSVELAEVIGIDVDFAARNRDPAGRAAADAAVRQPRGGRRRRPVVLRARRVLRVRAGDEDAGRRARSARADLHRVRDGGVGGRRSGPAGVADLRRRRRRPDRRRDLGPDRRAGTTGAEGQLPASSTRPTR